MLHERNENLHRNGRERYHKDHENDWYWILVDCLGTWCRIHRSSAVWLNPRESKQHTIKLLTLWFQFLPHTLHWFSWIDHEHSVPSSCRDANVVLVSCRLDECLSPMPYAIDRALHRDWNHCYQRVNDIDKVENRWEECSPNASQILAAQLSRKESNTMFNRMISIDHVTDLLFCSRRVNCQCFTRNHRLHFEPLRRREHGWFHRLTHSPAAFHSRNSILVMRVRTAELGVPSNFLI